MKKSRILALLVAAVMMMGAIAGCSSVAPQEASNPSAEQDAQSASDSPKAASDESTQTETPKLLVGCSVRSLSNPYHLAVTEGAQMFVDSLPPGTAELQILTCEGSDEKQINDIKALVARGGENTILYVDPNQSPNCAAIAQICEEAGVYWTSVWNPADGIYPMDYEYYVMHQSPDNEQLGYDIAIELFKSFETPYEGKILAVQGMLANLAAIGRFRGLQRALEEHPGVELLADQPGDWNSETALSVTETWLSKYDDIDGIWCANDVMAVGALQALKAKGLNGKVKVAGVDAITDILDAIKADEAVVTIDINPWSQGAIGLAWAYAAWSGKIKPSELSQEQRMFYTKHMVITSENVEQYENDFIKSKPTIDFEDIEAVITRPMSIEDFK